MRKPLLALMLAACCSLGTAHAADLPPLAHKLTMQAPKPAPALKLKDIEGKSHDLAKLKGKVVLINFWATWCPPCRREMPSMERLSQRFKGQPFVVLAVDVGEDVDTIETFTSQLDTTLTFPILLDTRSHAMRAWRVAGLPTTFLVDKQGRIVASAIGGREFDHPEIVKTVGDLVRK
ncbi:MAG: TlpA disulfide reductase family protein [Thiobacillus sp.]|uniref:TlpA family protein disulfide reductase n=1 Tax=Thiobacillus sp. TaxID=924 RepID=UPI00273486B6|nr:TlpA disulfide reductase family protein [Thiobacillus sp.]MDP3421792.1 TlpA disulfide reductase family protein [Thiobacillus sp.]MDP3585325.1 TlpA disulfide reductase family protein [Thiobacillus sp.]